MARAPALKVKQVTQRSNLTAKPLRKKKEFCEWIKYVILLSSKIQSRTAINKEDN